MTDFSKLYLKNRDVKRGYFMKGLITLSARFNKDFLHMTGFVYFTYFIIIQGRK